MGKFLIVLLTSYSFAVKPPSGKSLCLDGSCGDNLKTEGHVETAKTTEKVTEQNTILKRSTKKKAEPKVKIRMQSNLPAEFNLSNRDEFNVSKDVFWEPKESNEQPSLIHEGDVITATIGHLISATLETEVPVRAIVTSDKGRGGVLIGNALLQKSLKRILVNFDRFRVQNKSYAVNAVAFYTDGKYGLPGEYHSDTGKFFLAELASSAAAAVADSTINRSQNVLGNLVEERSILNSGKHGAVSALSKTTEKLAETSRNSQPLMETERFLEISVMFLGKKGE